MRHWLAGRLKAERPKLYARLPREYDRGAELPSSARFRSPPLSRSLGNNRENYQDYEKENEVLR